MEQEAQFDRYHKEDLPGGKDIHSGYSIRFMLPGRLGRRSALSYFIYRLMHRT